MCWNRKPPFWWIFGPSGVDLALVSTGNFDDNRDVPAKFGIRGIPTLIMFKDGQIAATKVGALTKAQLTAFIDQQLA